MRRTTATTSMFRSVLLLSFGTGAAAAWAQQDPGPEFKALHGSYLMYSSGLGDPQPAKAGGGKVAFVIDGDAARKMFDSMAPDVRDSCTEGSGTRVRTKGNLSCQREKRGEYSCSFGFDLRTGKSIAGSVC